MKISLDKALSLMYNLRHGKKWCCNSAYKVSGSSGLPSNSTPSFQRKLPDFIFPKVPCSKLLYSGILASFSQEDRDSLKNSCSVWPDNRRPDGSFKSGEGVFQERKSPEFIEAATLKVMLSDDEYLKCLTSHLTIKSGGKGQVMFKIKKLEVENESMEG